MNSARAPSFFLLRPGGLPLARQEFLTVYARFLRRGGT